MGRTHKFFSDGQKGNLLPEYCSPDAAEQAFGLLEGRWKLAILYHLFHRDILRFSDLERAIPKISQRMLSRQLRDLEHNSIIRRTVFPEVPPRVEYRLTEFGLALRPAMHALLEWAALRNTLKDL